MTARPYACLDEVRHAILSRRLMRFYYRRAEVIVEPHLLGNAIKTRALILYGWRPAPESCWEHFRYAEIRNPEILQETFEGVREGFNPYDRRIAGIDTSLKPGRFPPRSA
jgi:hypothetical protein